MPADIVENGPAPPVASMDLAEDPPAAPSYSAPAAPSAGFVFTGWRRDGEAAGAAAAAAAPSVDQMVLKLLQMGVLAIVSIPPGLFASTQKPDAASPLKTPVAAAPAAAPAAAAAAPAPAPAPAVALVAPAVTQPDAAGGGRKRARSQLVPPPSFAGGDAGGDNRTRLPPVPAPDFSRLVPTAEPEARLPGINPAAMAAPDMSKDAVHYTNDERQKLGVFALSAYEPKESRVLLAGNSELVPGVSTDNIAVYNDKTTGRIHIGVRGTQLSNLLETAKSAFARTEGKDGRTDLEREVFDEVVKVRAFRDKNFKNESIDFWGHSHGAQLISMARKPYESANVFAGYVREGGVGRGVTKNLRSANDIVINTLGSLHPLDDGADEDFDIESAGGEHSLESYINTDTLAVYKQHLKTRRAETQSLHAAGTEVVKSDGELLAEGKATYEAGQALALGDPEGGIAAIAVAGVAAGVVEVRTKAHEAWVNTQKFLGKLLDDDDDGK